MRVITAQGPTQLLSVLAILQYLQRMQNADSSADILVIGGLYSENYSDIIHACKRISSQWNFEKIIILGVNLALSASNPGSNFRSTAELGYLARAEEIFVCRNWDRFNEEMIGLCANADVVCYGDGFGWLDAILPEMGADHPARRRQRLDKIFLHDPPNFSGFKFPLGLITDILEIVPASYLVTVITNSRRLFPSINDYIFPAALERGNPLVIVTLSNFSESNWVKQSKAIRGLVKFTFLFKNIARSLFSWFGLSTADKVSAFFLRPLFPLIINKELRLYEEYLLRYLDRHSHIILKAHPRQSYNQSGCLASRLQRHGFNVQALSMSLSVIPIELFEALNPVNSFFAMGSSSASTTGLASWSPNIKLYEQIDIDIRRKYFSAFALHSELDAKE